MHSKDGTGETGQGGKGPRFCGQTHQCSSFRCAMESLKAALGQPQLSIYCISRGDSAAENADPIVKAVVGTINSHPLHAGRVCKVLELSLKYTVSASQEINVQWINY